MVKRPKTSNGVLRPNRLASPLTVAVANHLPDENDPSRITKRQRATLRLNDMDHAVYAGIAIGVVRAKIQYNYNHQMPLIACYRYTMGGISVDRSIRRLYDAGMVNYIADPDENNVPRLMQTKPKEPKCPQ